MKGETAEGRRHGQGSATVILCLILTSTSLYSTGWAQPVPADSAREAQENPRYVGVAGCTCHATKDLGDQFRAWTRLGHARAWVMLQGAQARRVGERAGVNGDPQKSELCLACHAAAARVDRRYVDPTFRFEDGVQCESCHGPAGNHVAIRRGQAKTMPTGLKMPTREDCMGCHLEKPSHAILDREKYDIEKAWKKIAHPIPATRQGSPP